MRLRLIGSAAADAAASERTPSIAVLFKSVGAVLLFPARRLATTDRITIDERVNDENSSAEFPDECLLSLR
jgi:hypothetical protein